jgi:hypothetical protein
VDTEKPDILKAFRQIPGVGKSIAEDFWELGLRRVDDLRGRDPQRLYDDFCRLRGMHVDRCMLYVFRCAVYYAETPDEEREPEKLLWWNWKDRPTATRRSR